MHVLFVCVFAGFGLRRLLVGLLFIMTAVVSYFGVFGCVGYCVLCALLWLVSIPVLMFWCLRFRFDCLVLLIVALLIMMVWFLFFLRGLGYFVGLMEGCCVLWVGDLWLVTGG